MDDERGLGGLVEFLRRAERLKDTLRSGYTSRGRQESVADHTWRLCLMALLLRDRFPEVDFGRLVAMCIVHDLGEAVGGDVPAPIQVGAPPKSDSERSDLESLVASLSEERRDELLGLWDEYEAAATPEGRLAKALDKLETLLQHTQGANPPGFDYRFNLDYGRRYTAGDPTIEALRAILDDETRRRADEAEMAPTRARQGVSANKDTVERYVEGFRRGDHEQILACLTDDVEWVIPGHARLVGKEAFDGEIENPAFQGRPAIEVVRLTEEEDVVVAEGTVRAQRADGGRVDLVFCDVFEMRAGRIRRLVSYLAPAGDSTPAGGSVSHGAR